MIGAMLLLLLLLGTSTHGDAVCSSWFRLLNINENNQPITNRLENTLVWNTSSNISLLNLINKFEDLQRKLLPNATLCMPYILTDLKGTSFRIVHEAGDHKHAITLDINLLRKSDHANWESDMVFKEALQSQVSEAILSVVQNLPAPGGQDQSLSVFVNDDEQGHLFLTNILQLGRERQIKFTSLLKLERSNMSSRIEKAKLPQCTAIIIDCEGEQLKSLLRLLKEINPVGAFGAELLVLTERSMKSLLTMNLLMECTYLGVKMIQGISHDLKDVPGITASTDVRQHLVKSSFKSMLFQLIHDTNAPNGMQWQQITSNQLAWNSLDVIDVPEQLQPKLRVGIANSWEPWVIIVPISRSDGRYNCGLNGKLGYRYVNASTNKTAPMCVYGLDIDMLSYLEDKLGFLSEIVQSRDKLYGIYNEAENKATGVAGMILRNEADIGINFISSPSRRKILHLSTDWTNSKFGFAYVQKTTLGESGIFNPFSFLLWVAIIFGVLSLVVVIWCFEKIRRKIKTDSVASSESNVKFKTNLTYMWGIFFGGEIIDDKPVSHGSHVAMILISFVSIMIVCAYSANLISFLVVLDETPIVTGLYDPKLLNHNSKLRIGTLNGSILVATLREHSDRRLQHLATRLKEFNSFKDCFSVLIKGEIDILFLDYLSLKSYASRDSTCSIKVMPVKLPGRGLTAIVNRNLKWKKRIDDAIMEMMHSGKADELYKTWLNNGGCKKSQQFHQLQINHVKSLFYMLPGGILIGVLSTAFLWFYNRLCKHGNRNEAQQYTLKSSIHT